MKYKLLKKWMLLCMSFSLTVTMLPAPVFAAGAKGDNVMELPVSDLGDAPGGGQDTEDTGAGDMGDVPDIQVEPETKHPQTESEQQSEGTHEPGTEPEQGFQQPPLTPLAPQTEVPEIPEVPEAPQEASPADAGVSAEETETGVQIADQAARSGGEPVFVNESGTPIPYYPNPAEGQVNYYQKDENGNYTILQNVTMILEEGVSVGDVDVAAGVTLTLQIMGHEDNSINQITGTGFVVVDEQSNGKLQITKEIASTIGLLTINAGTILPGSAESKIKCNVVVTGGALTCDVLPEVSVKNKTGAVLKRIEAVTKEADAVCETADFKQGNKSLTLDHNNTGIWTDANGKVVLYLDNKADSFNLKTLAYETTTSMLRAFKKVYHYSNRNLSKNPSEEECYSVSVGGELKTVYGKAADAVQVVKISKNENISEIEWNAEDIDERSRDKMKLKLEDETDSHTGKKHTVYKVEQMKAKEVPSGSTPYGWLATVKVTDIYGMENEISGTVTLTVEKAELTPVIDVDKDKLEDGTSKVTKVYDGTTDVPDGICSLKLEGAVEGDDVTGTASFAYNNANVKYAKSIVISDIKLDGKWGTYYTCKAASAKTTSAAITKAPCPKEPKEIDEDQVTATYNTIQFKGVAGQEYAYRSSSSGTSTSGLRWAACKKSSKCTIKNTSAKTEYTLYTRIAETDNYLASDEVSVDVETLRSPNKANASGVSISGITDNGTYKLNTELTLTAKGVEPTTEDYSLDDEKYVPYCWKLENTTVWKKEPYTAVIKPVKAGTYTVVVTFHKYVYNGTKWVRAAKGDTTKSVTFKANETGTASTTTTTGTRTTTSPTTIRSTTTAAKTNDPAPVVPLMGAFLASGLAAAYMFKKNRTKKEK